MQIERLTMIVILMLAANMPAIALSAEEDLSASSGKLSLDWLVSQQADDGGWSFEDKSPKDTKAPLANTFGSRTGATGLAMLVFLAHGQTHKRGDYKKNIAAGGKFLLTTARRDGKMLDLRGQGNRMRWHGVATLALVEAYAMTREKALHEPAQRAIDFIAHMQDKKTGGWPDVTDEPPSMTVTAWQLLALWSAHMGYLEIDAKTIKPIEKFLDGVQSGEGAYYGESKSGKEPLATAAGLLCRGYLGSSDSPAVKTGVNYLATKGPTKDDPQYNYFGTRLASIYRVPTWNRWRGKVQPMISNAQQRDEPQRGSWAATDGKHGGRLFTTTLNAMTLEVRPPAGLGPRYFGPPATDDDDFPGD
jgi:hypothetical protein